MRKRIVSVLLALTLCAGPFSAAAHAASYDNFYYNQLDENSKQMYDIVIQDWDRLWRGEPYQFPSELGDSTNMCKALLLDHPELFWLGGRGLSGSDGKTKVTFYISSGWSNGQRSISEDEAYLKAQVTALAEKARAAGSTTYAQLLYVHDWLTHNNAYDVQYAKYGVVQDDAAYTALSALDPKLAPVCAGYARAFKLVCDELGVPCILVDGICGGENHDWNYVQMNDGKWYAVDVTLDDPIAGSALVSGQERRKYFLMGTQIHQDHTLITEESHNPNVYYSIYWKYPALSSSNFDPKNATEAPPVTVPTVGGFTDVTESAYYAAPVEWAVEKEITAGTTATTFSPSNTCTRAQIITFLWRAAGSPEPESNTPFSDVKADAYYAKATAWAAEQGMEKGSAFSPNAPCTRLMAVEFMWKYAGSPEAPEAAFTDVASGAVNWAVKQGVTNGTSTTAFSPERTCTRGQIVTFLHRAMG